MKPARFDYVAPETAGEAVSFLNDYAGEAKLYELIASLRERIGCGILLVSHDLHIVMAATDRVVCLNHHVCCTGAPSDVSRHAEYRRLFGARAQEAVALYQHHHDHHHDLDGVVVAEDGSHTHEQGHP